MASSIVLRVEFVGSNSAQPIDFDVIGVQKPIRNVLKAREAFFRHFNCLVRARCRSNVYRPLAHIDRLPVA
jgi:hypothetical protein